MAKDTHDVLRALVDQARCKPGWHFRLKDEDGALRLVIRVAGFDSAKPDLRVPMSIDHYFPVPTATYNEKSWRRWMFEMCRRVENHELGEWFRIVREASGASAAAVEWPFAPLHGPGENPYDVHEFRPADDALTTQDGSTREPYGLLPPTEGSP